MPSPFRHHPPGAPAAPLRPHPVAHGLPARAAASAIAVLGGIGLAATLASAAGAQAPTRRPAARDVARPTSARPDGRAAATPATAKARPTTPTAPGAGARQANAPGANAPKAGAPTPVTASAPRPAGPPLRLEVDIAGRRLYALRGQDTLLVTSAAVASQDTLAYAGRTWVFRTPKGTRRVLGKQSDPWWTPPDWFYAETAQRHGLRVRYLAPGSRVALSEGRRLVVRDSAVGVLLPNDPAFHPLPEDEHVVFGDTLFVPPGGTRHRRISGQLGAFRLDLGEGFLIHGTPDERTVGTASTHGCVRLDGVALAWVFQHTPVGTAVVIR